MKLLKEAKAKKFSVEYYVKLHYDEEVGRYSVYTNNSNFNWGYSAVYDSLEEAENDFWHIINKYDFYKWEVK